MENITAEVEANDRPIQTTSITISHSIHMKIIVEWSYGQYSIYILQALYCIALRRPLIYDLSNDLEILMVIGYRGAAAAAAPAAAKERESIIVN